MTHSTSVFKNITYKLNSILCLFVSSLWFRIPSPCVKAGTQKSRTVSKWWGILNHDTPSINLKHAGAVPSSRLPLALGQGPKFSGLSWVEMELYPRFSLAKGNLYPETAVGTETTVGTPLFSACTWKTWWQTLVQVGLTCRHGSHYEESLKQKHV